MPDPASIDISTRAGADGAATVVFQGVLDAGTAGEVWEQATRAVRQASGEVQADVSGVRSMDGVGLGLLAALKTIQAEKGRELEIAGLDPGYQAVLSRFDVSALAREDDGESGPELGPVSRVGRFGWDVLSSTRGIVVFVGECAAALAYAVVRPRSLRFKDLVKQCELVGVHGLGIVTLIGFLMGLILAFQTSVALMRFGAQSFVPNMLGLAMVREMGPLVTAILLAGRSGSAFAAEIGTMQVNDEVNALTTMGLDPMRFLVTPKVLAAVIMTPVLTLYFDVLSFVGGAVVMLPMDFPLSSYMSRLFANVTMVDFLGSMIKAVVFSLLVAGVGCMQGLRTGTGAGAVGESTTAAVVGGIVLIAVADGLFAVIYYALGI